MSRQQAYADFNLKGRCELLGADTGKEEVMSEADEQQYGVSRLVSFSDGVFGFAITLLITTIPFSLAIPVPVTNMHTVQALLALLPQLYAYVFSFFMVGNYWIVHHRTFQRYTKFNTTLLWINLSLLLFIAFLPFPTALLGRYGSNSVITAMYATTQFMISLIYVLMEWYAFSHALISPPPDQKTLKYIYLRGLIPCAIFALSGGIAFYSVVLAKLSWIAVLVIRPVVLRKYRPEEA
jgi:uncharacterized membrane protein